MAGRPGDHSAFPVADNPVADNLAAGSLVADSLVVADIPAVGIPAADSLAEGDSGRPAEGTGPGEAAHSVLLDRAERTGRESRPAERLLLGR